MTMITIPEKLRPALHDAKDPHRDDLMAFLKPYDVTPDQWVKDTYEDDFDDYSSDYAYCHSKFSRNWSVAVYHSELGHGGSEEGGWWYEYGYLQDLPVMYFETHREAVDARNCLQSLLDKGPDWNLNRREMSSVISDGRFIARVHHTHPPKSYPDERPRYS